MTARSDKYDDYRKALLVGGAPAEEADAMVAEMKTADAKIDVLTCPKCGAPLTRTLDSRQHGPTKVVGKWFNYRCTTPCCWFGDRCEPIGEYPEQGRTGTPDRADYERELRRLARPSHTSVLRPFQEPPTHQVGTTYTCGNCLTPLLQGHMCVRVETLTGSYTKIIR